MKIFLNGGGSGTKTQETYKKINKIINQIKNNSCHKIIPLKFDKIQKHW